MLVEAAHLRGVKIYSITAPAQDQRNEEAVAAYNAENLRKLILKRDELRNLWIAEQAFRKLMGLPIEAPCSAGMSCLTGAYVRLRAEEGNAEYCIHEVQAAQLHEAAVAEHAPEFVGKSALFVCLSGALGMQTCGLAHSMHVRSPGSRRRPPPQMFTQAVF